MRTTLKLSFVALLITLALDFVWIGFVATNFYKTQYGALYSPHPVLYAAILFYLIYAVGVAHFVVGPALRNHSLKQAVFNGGFFALVAFGTYDLTSLAVTTNWPVVLSVVDMTWGVFQGMVVSGGTYVLARKFFKA
jgi:uncharacterized membrane protein